MSPCLDSETLKSILQGTLAETAAAACHAHLEACPDCRAQLEELSDFPELRRWAEDAHQATPPVPAGPQLQRLVSALCVATVDQAPDTNAMPALPLSFLSPPCCDGDLGTLGSYRILAEVGRGGMGVVLRGFDEALQRTVAIKVLRPELTTDQTRARMRHEAQAVARFTHEHVVRIHAVAATPEGLPYLVMEYLAGQTLGQRLRAGPLAPAPAAAIVVQIAAGLAAAHAAGLIHRDVKPSNIMLEPTTDRAKLLDFGLARLVERPSGTTHEGLLAGTPAYMSPEQVQGLAAVDGRTDVYSLGVTLYEALTGEAPFRGQPHLVLQQVLREEPRPPRQLNDAIPRDLETICLKALAKEPGRRYQTAGDLADDLQRWQRGEPVRARPVGRLGRLGRWCRRNPRVAVLAALLLLVLAGGFAGVSWQWYRAEISRAAFQQEFERAEENLRAAVEAVDYYHTRVSEEQLLKQPGLQPLRKDLLEAARKFYAGFVAQHRDDPAVRTEYALSLFRLANITRDVGSLPRAIELMEEAAALQEQLAEANPEDMAAQVQLAFVLNNLGNLYHYASQIDRAEATFRRSLELSQRLVREHPRNPDGLRGVYRGYNNLGYVYLIRSQPDAAERALQKAVAVSQVLIDGWPKEPGYRRDQIRPLVQLGELYVQREGHRAQADKAYRQALVLAEGLVRDFPKVADYRVALAECCAFVGSLDLIASQVVPWDVAAGKRASARAAQQRAVELIRPLARANPAVLDYQLRLCDRLAALGGVELAAGRLAAAEAVFRELLQVAEPLARDNPQDLRMAVMPAVAAANLGAVLGERGQFEAALSELDRGCRQLDKLLRDKDNVLFRTWLSQTYVARALTLLEQKRYPEALADWERAIASDAGQYRHLKEAGRILTQARVTGARAAMLPRPLYAQAAAQGEHASTTLPLTGGGACFLAQIQALAAAAATADDQLTPADRSQRAEQYAARAVDLLFRAHRAGYFRVPGRRQHLAHEPVWEPLRSRRTFQKLLAEVTAE